MKMTIFLELIVSNDLLKDNIAVEYLERRSFGTRRSRVRNSVRKLISGDKAVWLATERVAWAGDTVCWPVSKTGLLDISGVAELGLSSQDWAYEAQKTDHAEIYSDA